jgi:hypothetical protein
MNRVLDDSLIGLALLLSASYVVVSLGPRGLRRRLVAGWADLTARVPALFGMRRMAAWLHAAAASKAAGSCGGCDNCGSESPSTPGSQPVAPEVRIPVGKIGRRV